jgi:hypothetical protein
VTRDRDTLDRRLQRSPPSRPDHEQVGAVLVDSLPQAILGRAFEQANVVAGPEAQPHAKGGDELLCLRHRLFDDVHQHQPCLQPVREPARGIGDRVGGVRRVESTDDRLGHRAES